MKPTKCRHSYCPNSYTHVIGADGSWPKDAKGECVPCLFAGQMVSQNQSIESVEAVPELMSQFESFLSRTGWSWQDVKDSHDRLQQLSPEARESEVMM